MSLVFLYLIAAIILLGWTIPLTMGIVRTKKKTGGGTGLIILGSVWGFLGICGMLIIGAGYFVFRSFQTTYETKEFNLSQYEGETGSIILSHKGESVLELADQETRRRKQFSTTNGVIVAPVGSFSVYSYEATATHPPQGEEWQARCRFSSGQQNTLNVQTNSPALLDIGPPFSAKVTAKKLSDGRHSFDFVLTGRGGNRFTLRAGSHSSPPRFEALSTDGQVVWKGRFQYG